MKTKMLSITQIQTAQTVDFTTQVLLSEEQLKIKGGASPWLEDK